MALPARDLTQLLTDLRRTKTLVTPQELAHRLPPCLPTGLGGLDRLLGGGLPQGRIVEIGEAKGALGTALALRILARFTASGRLAAVVDRAGCFDPRSAADAGVDLERTLWCRPASHKDAVRATDALLASGAFALVILDLGARQPQRGRGFSGPGGRPAGGAVIGLGRAGAHGGSGTLVGAGAGAAAGVHSGASGQGTSGKGALVRGAFGARTGGGGGGSGFSGGVSEVALAAEPTLVRTAPGEGAPPDELHVELYGTGPRRKRADPRDDDISQAAWLRLARDAETARAALLVLGGGGAGTFATASLRPVRSRALFVGSGPGRTFEGLELTVALERNKLGLSPDEAKLTFRAPELFPTGQRDPLPGAARLRDDPAASRRKAWHLGDAS